MEKLKSVGMRAEVTSLGTKFFLPKKSRVQIELVRIL